MFAKYSRVARRPIWQQQPTKVASRWIATTLVVFAGALLTTGSYLIYDGMPKEGRAEVATGVLALVVGFLFLMWKLPQLAIPDAAELSVKERLELRDKSRTTLAQILGAIALLVGIYSVAENWRIARNSEFTDRLVRCIQLLAAENKDGKKQIDSRVGAIYSLDRIARDSVREQRVIHEILAAYIQTNSPKGRPASDHFDADLQAALNILVKRDYRYDPPGAWLDLSDAEFQFADFTAGAQITNTPLGGVAKIGRIRLVNSNLDGAFLSGLDLSGVILSNASLRHAFLEKTRLDNVDLTSADLTAARLKGASLRGARLDRAILSGADLSDVEITELQLDGALGDERTILPRGAVAPAKWRATQ